MKPLLATEIATQVTEISRRTFLRTGAGGLGLLGLQSLMAQTTGAVSPLHHAARAKRVIFLYQAGGPSHLGTFDSKPKVGARGGEPMPEAFTKGQQLAQLQRQKLMCFAPQFAFRKFGRSGQEM